MAAQDEIAFPTTMKSTSTSEPSRERSEDNETDKESLSPADYGLDLGDEVQPVYEPPENEPPGDSRRSLWQESEDIDGRSIGIELNQYRSSLHGLQGSRTKYQVVAMS